MVVEQSLPYRVGTDLQLMTRQEALDDAGDGKRRTAMRNVRVLGVVVLSLSFLTTPVFAESVEGQSARDPMTVSGVVTKVHSGMIVVKTSRGPITFASNVLAGLQIGEQVEMQVNRS